MHLPKETMYSLNNEHATIIRNLLHNERIQYEYCDYKGTDAVYFKTITEAIARMEHPEQFTGTNNGWCSITRRSTC